VPRADHQAAQPLRQLVEVAHTFAGVPEGDSNSCAFAIRNLLASSTKNEEGKSTEQE
jgi:hypothetical protein